MQQDLNQRTTTMADNGLPDSKRYNYTLQEKYKALRRWRMDGCNTSKTARDEKNDYPRENIHFSVFGKVGQR